MFVWHWTPEIISGIHLLVFSIISGLIFQRFFLFCQWNVRFSRLCFEPICRFVAKQKMKSVKRKRKRNNTNIANQSVGTTARPWSSPRVSGFIRYVFTHLGPSLCLFLCVSLYLCLSLSLCVSRCVSVSLCVCPSVSLFLFVCVCPSVCLSLGLYLSLSVSVSQSLPVSLSLSVCPSLRRSLGLGPSLPILSIAVYNWALHQLNK